MTQRRTAEHAATLADAQELAVAAAPRFPRGTRACFAAALVCSAAALAADPADPPDLADPVEPEAQSIFEYDCAGGKKVITVVFAGALGETKLILSVKDDPRLKDLEFHQVMAASGVKSSNGKLIWWTKGDEGFLMEEYPPAGSGEMVIQDCKEVSLR